MAYSKIFTAVFLALVVKDRALSCTLRAHNNSGQPSSSKTESTTIPVHTSVINGSSFSPNSDKLNETASSSLIDSTNQNPVTPLFIPESPVMSMSSDENQILMQLLLQRLPATPIYDTIPAQPSFSSPISIYGPSSNFPDYIKHALLQQINPSSTPLKPQSSYVETFDPKLSYPPLSSSSTLKNPITIPNMIPETGPIITPNDDDIAPFTSYTSTGYTEEPITASAQKSINTPTPNLMMNDNFTPSSSSPCPECNSTPSTESH